ncbi:MAG: methyltransferase domain-containing protein [bacterium]|nr:methyltransferase domain-containing protein [bacterium]
MRIAYFSPISPIKSGISKYSEDILPYLAKHAEVDLFIDAYQPTNPAITAAFTIHPYIRYYELASRYDMALYHLGNNAYHQYLYPFTLTHPGIIVLHDFILFHLLAGITYVNYNFPEFIIDMETNHGLQGRYAAERFIAGTFSEIDKFQFPMNKTIIESSYGVVVHSEYYQQYIQEHYPHKPVVTIPMSTGEKFDILDQDTKTKLRKQYGFTSDEILIASFGFISPIKHIDIALRAIARLTNEFPNIRYILVGESNKTYDIYREIKELSLEPYVRVTEFVDDQTYYDYLNIADISINLRYPSAGETSLTLHQSFAAGIPTLVSNYRQYAEYPDNCCLKVDLAPNEEEHLVQLLRQLITDETLRHEIGSNARKYVLENCTLEIVAKEYIDFIEEIIHHQPRKSGKTNREMLPLVLENIQQEIDTLDLTPMENSILHEASILIPYRYEKEIKGGVTELLTMKNKKKNWDIAAEEVAKKYDPELSIRIPLVWKWPPNMSGRYIYDFSVVALSLELPVNSLILDVAAGSCWVSEWLHQLGYRTVAFDISPTQLKYGKRRFESNPRLYKEFWYGFVCADGEQLPFADSTFDGVVCLNSLHHMPNFQKVLNELSRILKPEGKAVFSEPGAMHGDSELSKREMQEFGTLEKSVDIDEIYQLAIQAGFKKMTIKPVVYPDVMGYSYQEWQYVEQLHPDAIKQFTTCYAVHVRNTHPIFILHKSESVVYDSRRPRILKAEIKEVNVPQRIKRNEPITITARIKNIGDTIWLHQESPFGGYVRFGVKLVSLTGQLLQAVKQQSLEKDIHPGEEFKITVETAIDFEPGKYALKFDMVDEQLCWFADCGSKEYFQSIEII